MKRHKIIKEKDELTLLKNESLFPSIAQEIICNLKISPSDIFLYKSPYNIIDKLSKSINVKFDNIFMNNGSECIIKQVVEILSKETKNWVITSPTFELIDFYCEYYSNNIERVPYEFLKDKFILDLSNIKDRSNKILFVVSPHNPTGYIIKNIKKLCKDYKYVIIDEAYINPMTPIYLKPNNLIRIRSFSKMGGITGMRVGFGICNKKLSDEMNQLRPMYLPNININALEYIINNNICGRIEKIIKNKIKVLPDVLKNNIIANSGNFIIFKNIKQYKNFKFKKYIISRQEFYRMTIYENI